MYYILVMDGRASENIPEYDPIFPNIPIEQRYAPDFLARCVKSEMEVPQGWIYDPATDTFSEPELMPAPADEATE